MSYADINTPNVEPRIGWWHLIGTIPILVVFLSAISLTGLESPLFWAIQVFLGVLYVPVLVLDVRYVRQLGTNWQPETWRYVPLGLAVLYSAGFLSLIVSPYYLYKRRKHTGAP
jgi:hypothetical protein